MTVMRRSYGRFALASLGVLAACSTPVKPPPPTSPPPVVETVRPLPPLGAAPDMDVPDKDGAGRWITPNRNVSGETALWHVRMALNVAALSCRDPSATVLRNYNAMLHIHKVPLALANSAVDNGYRARYGANFMLPREKLNTTVYNFFALPPVQKSFCLVASDVGTRINSLSAEALMAYAPEALAALEKPFEDFYELYADYLRRLNEWYARYGTVTVTASPAPLGDRPQPPAPPPLPVAPSGVQTLPPRLETQPLPEAPGQ